MKVLGLLLSIALLAGCDVAETFLSRAELERRGYNVETPAPTPTPTFVPSWKNTDPRKGKVRIDRHCGFWSCQNAYAQCMGPTLLLTPADGSTPVRVPHAEECKR